MIKACGNHIHSHLKIKISKLGGYVLRNKTNEDIRLLIANVLNVFLKVDIFRIDEDEDRKRLQIGIRDNMCPWKIIIGEECCKGSKERIIYSTRDKTNLHHFDL